MTCRFPGCDRDARKGWTTCPRHYTAGNNRRIHPTGEVASPADRPCPHPVGHQVAIVNGEPVFQCFTCHAAIKADGTPFKVGTHLQTSSSTVACGAPMRQGERPGWDLGDITVEAALTTCPQCVATFSRSAR